MEEKEIKHLSEIVNSIYYIDGPNHNQKFNRIDFRIKPFKSNEKVEIIYREIKTWIYKEELDNILIHIKDINKIIVLKYTIGLTTPFTDNKFNGIVEDGYQVHLFYTED